MRIRGTECWQAAEKFLKEEDEDVAHMRINTSCRLPIKSATKIWRVSVCVKRRWDSHPRVLVNHRFPVWALLVTTVTLSESAVSGWSSHGCSPAQLAQRLLAVQPSSWFSSGTWKRGLDSRCILPDLHLETLFFFLLNCFKLSELTGTHQYWWLRAW